MDALAPAGVRLDVLVGSANDPGETYVPGTLDPEPLVVVRTCGGDGGTWDVAPDAVQTPPVPWLIAGEPGDSWQATALPGPPADAYGCGDSFAAALAYGLGAGMMLRDAIGLAARCGAAVLCGRGPYGAMLELPR